MRKRERARERLFTILIGAVSECCESEQLYAQDLSTSARVDGPAQLLSD